MRDGAKASVAGVVLVASARLVAGVVFMTIEDETGIDIVIGPEVLERERSGDGRAPRRGACRIQRHEDIIHVVATRLEDRSDWLASSLRTARP